MQSYPVATNNDLVRVRTKERWKSKETDNVAKSVGKLAYKNRILTTLRSDSILQL